MRMLSRFFAIFVLFLFTLSALAQNIGDEKARAKNILNMVSSEIEKNYFDPTFDPKLAP